MEEIDNKQTTLKDFLTRHVTGVDITAGVVIVFLVMLSVFYSLRYKQIESQLNLFISNTQTAYVNQEVLKFTELFVNEVLRAEGEISFDTRLELEGAVRSLEDEEILNAWVDFTNSQTEAQAQEAVKDLLALLVLKIK